MSKVKRENDGSFTIDFIKMVNGKRVHIYKKGYETEEGAQKAIPILTEKRLSSFKQHKASGKFESFFDVYLEHRSRKVGKSTLIAIKGIYNAMLKDYGSLDASEVLSLHSMIHFHRMIAEKEGIGEKYKNRVIGELRQVVDYACILKIISPEEATDDKAILEQVPIKKKSKEKECYTANQLKKFLSVIDNEEDRDLMITYAYLGARISEFIALTWDCYDPKNKTIEIKQQILYLQQGKPVLVDRLKTRESYRKCKLNDEVYKILEKRRGFYGEKGYIFPKNHKSFNEPIPKATIRAKMQRYMKKAKLPLISPHGFRHTKATMFMSVCKTMAEVKAAAKFLGHSVTMMMETYAHQEEKTIDILIKRIDEK